MVSYRVGIINDLIRMDLRGLPYLAAFLFTDLSMSTRVSRNTSIAFKETKNSDVIAEDINIAVMYKLLI